MKYFIVAFVAFCALSTLIGWCGGYNFDSRTPGVGMWVAFTFVAALIVGAAIYDLYGKDK